MDDGYKLERLIVDQPEVYAKEPYLKRLTPFQWVTVLKEKPDLAEQCDSWDKITPFGWLLILRVQPHFLDKCDKWSKFSEAMWLYLEREVRKVTDERYDKLKIFIKENKEQYLIMKELE